MHKQFWQAFTQLKLLEPDQFLRNKPYRKETLELIYRNRIPGNGDSVNAFGLNKMETGKRGVSDI